MACGSRLNLLHSLLYYRYVPQLWEISDGAIYLFAELCAEDLRSDGYAEEFLPLLADLTHLQHFPEAEKLSQTVWEVLPVAAKRLGKQKGFPYLKVSRVI